MPTMHQYFLRPGYAALSGAVAALLTAGTAQASFIETVAQSGPDILVTGSGTIDLAGLSPVASESSYSSFINPSVGAIVTGSGAAANDDYTGFAGPATFGGGGPVSADTGSGDIVAMFGNIGQLRLPGGYLSGGVLSNTATYANATFSSLGLTPGTYTWVWGNGDHADSFVLNISAVPEPPTLSLLGLGVIIAGAARRRSRRHEAPCKVCDIPS